MYFARLTAVGCLKGRRTAVRERRRDDVKKVGFAEHRFPRDLSALYSVPDLGREISGYSPLGPTEGGPSR